MNSNPLEMIELLKETFDGIYMGRVEDVDDPESCGRAKVRVFGVYDAPIKLDHLPWAVPSNEDKRVRVGDLVTVQFMRGDHCRPVFF